MKANSAYRNWGTRFVVIPVLYALVLFLGIRVANDLPRRENYLDHGVTFVVVELATVLVMSVILYSFLDVWLKKSRQHRRQIVAEYVVVAMVSVMACFTTMYFVRLVIGIPLSMEEVPLPAVIAMLTTGCFYTLMRNRLTEQENEAQRLQLETLRNDRLQTELKFLRAQYHPHFLFNALNTIYFQIDEDNPAPRHTIETLAELLRYQLYNESGKVSLATETHHLQQFITLCKLRASKRLQLILDFGKLQTDIQIYPMLLLPLVENAFKYVSGDYKIYIGLQVTEATPHSHCHTLSFTVCNDTPKDMDTRLKASGRKHGLGLGNLKRRLQLLYPNLHELTLTQENGAFWALLTIKFPA